MLSVKYKPIVLNVIMLNVVILNVVMLNVVMLNVVMLNVDMLNVVMLNVIMVCYYAKCLGATKRATMLTTTLTTTRLGWKGLTIIISLFVRDEEKKIFITSSADGLTCWQCILQWTYVVGNNWGRGRCQFRLISTFHKYIQGPVS
jgi:hypothetical protein